MNLAIRNMKEAMWPDEGSYRELAIAIYGKSSVASNVNKYVKHLADIGLLVVAVNDDCNCFDTNRTCIYINPDWR